MTAPNRASVEVLEIESYEKVVRSLPAGMDWGWAAGLKIWQAALRQQSQPSVGSAEGPARMFDTIASRLRAGEEYDSVMADYRIRFDSEQSQPPAHEKVGDGSFQQRVQPWIHDFRIKTGERAMSLREDIEKLAIKWDIAHDHDANNDAPASMSVADCACQLRQILDSHQPAPAGEGAQDSYAEALAAFEVWYKETYPMSRADDQHKAGRRIIFMAGFKRGIAAPPTPATAVPEGWKLVRVIPTIEMLEAGFIKTRYDAGYSTRQDAYRAMLAASPAPSAGDVKGDGE